MKRLFVSTVMACAFSSTVLGAGLVNGSFEVPYLYPNSLLGISTMPSGTGWIVGSGTIDLKSNAYPWTASPVGPILTPYGDQFIDLNGDNPGSIYTDFTFPSAGQWVISFDIEANPNISNVKTMDVEFGQVGSLADIGSYSLAPYGGAWVNKTSPILTVDDSTTYRLQFTSTTGGSGGVLLDNVRLVPVPEPTTFTLLGLGSLALVMARRRR